VVDLVPSNALPLIVAFLAEGRGCQPP